MPYVPVAPVTRDRLLDVAQQRWDGILERRPDLKPAVDLQRRLLTLVIELAHTIDGGRLPRLSLPPKYIGTKLARGVPVFAGEPIPLPVQLLHASLLQLCGALASGGAGEAAEHIQSAIESGGMEAGSLLAASLARDQTAIRTGAVHRGLAPDLVWLVAELAVSPFAHALQRALFASAPEAKQGERPRPAPAEDSPPLDKLSVDLSSAEGRSATDAGGFPRAAETAVTSLGAALTGWNRGYCPACGSWPALAEVVGGHRVLRCSFCAVAWELATYACVYCEEDADPFVTAAADEERKDRRIELCSRCAGYLKTVDVPALSPFPLLAIADLETMDLDLVAMERGYTRPPLPGVVTRKPQR
jgi:formate dehydrogenase formation protein